MQTPGLAAARRAGLFDVTARKARPSGPPLSRIPVLVLLMGSAVSAGSLTILLDQPVTQATATTEKEPRTTIPGTITDHTVAFPNPTPGSAYEIQLTLKDGTVLQGVDMGWYSRVPEKKDADPLNDDDIQQMKAVFTAGAQFFNVQEATLIKGTHNRAVMLTLQQRDSKFHSDTDNEIIWRPELWYFENHHGGWEKVLQTDRVLRHERFANQKAYHDVVDHLGWVPELGGLKSTPKDSDVIVTLPPTAGVAMNAPSSQPSHVTPP